MMPELAFNPFIPRICSVIARRLADDITKGLQDPAAVRIPKEGFVSYDVYIAVLSVLSDRVSGAEKAQLSFEAFDVENEGKLDVMVRNTTRSVSFHTCILDSFNMTCRIS